MHSSIDNNLKTHTHAFDVNVCIISADDNDLCQIIGIKICTKLRHAMKIILCIGQ